MNHNDNPISETTGITSSDSNSAANQMNQYIRLGWVVVNHWIITRSNPDEPIDQVFHCLLSWNHEGVKPERPLL